MQPAAKFGPLTSQRFSEEQYDRHSESSAPRAWVETTQMGQITKMTFWLDPEKEICVICAICGYQNLRNPTQSA
jgi:hypothetical protein